MKEKFWITNGVRLTGLVGMFYVIRHWMLQFHRFGHVHFNRSGLLKLVFEIGLMLVGVYMLRGAPLIVKFIWPKDDDKNLPK